MGIRAPYTSFYFLRASTDSAIKPGVSARSFSILVIRPDATTFHAYLAHVGLEPDERVQLDRDDVAIGADGALGSSGMYFLRAGAGGTFRATAVVKAK